MGFLEIGMVILSAALLLIPAWRIADRMGYPGWFGLGIMVPMLNIALLWIVAFAKWPSER